MTPSLLIVFMNAKGGRDDEFNDWYTNVHIRDVMRLPGSTAVQRFRLGSPSYADKSAHRYLALYEIADRKACIQGHLERLYTPRMPISPAGDFSDLLVSKACNVLEQEHLAIVLRHPVGSLLNRAAQVGLQRLVIGSSTPIGLRIFRETAALVESR